jgi:hypothetical protein
MDLEWKSDHQQGCVLYNNTSGTTTGRGATPPPYYLGTLGIYSTAAGYSVDVHTGTEWISVVTSGSTNASYPVSGVGLRITAPNAANSPSSITVKYVFVSVPTPMEAPSH